MREEIRREIQRKIQESFDRVREAVPGARKAPLDPQVVKQRTERYAEMLFRSALRHLDGER